MSRCGPAILFLWTVLVAASPAQAQWFSNFWGDMKRDYHRNVDWPEPFLKADRDSVNMPFALMVANGWRRQNLISDYHFNEDNQQLNLAGETKLRFILTQMPPSRRAVYVQRGLTGDVTSKRLELVHHAALNVVGDRWNPQIVESDLPNDGTPADEINDVAQRFQSTRPDPRLSNASSSSGGGSGGGGGGGGGSGSSSGR
jgi:uncharacterized membrane protein YgcG